MKVVILAGGRGSRLWPISQRELPKQFVSLDGGKSLLEQTCARFTDPWVITEPKYASLASGKVIVEPSPRNTGPAVLYAVSEIAESNDDIFCFCPADHYFGDEEALHAALKEAKSAAEEGHIAILGTKPTHPETKYGYILPSGKFVEKPKNPQPLIDKGALWNIGIFVFSVKTLQEEVEKHVPLIEPLSFDKLVLEKTDRIKVIPFDSEWRDVGSWDAIYDMLDKDENANAIRGSVETHNSRGNLLIGGKKPIYVIGLNDCVVVNGPEGILVADKKNADLIKAMLDKTEKVSPK
jgi:mannose-1-phosphate guanylyltransferase / mannose-6-phosphate isomerase